MNEHKELLGSSRIGRSLGSLLLGGVSVLALGMASPAQAQEVETVVVTGQRAAIESAIAIKRNADSIVDSIAADDIGKLPDNSVTEVLQRMVGVNISHMSVGHGSEDYLGEGTNVTIRGLGDSAGMLNGRDSFSSNSGRTLSWEDIPPELFQGIDVYKSLMATFPEGGFGGVVNLRTRQPFDFDGFAAYGTLGGSFADYARKGNLSGSFLVSDRVNTKIGEFGLLVNISYSDLSSKSDGMQLSPYYPAVYNPGYASANPTGRLPVLSDTGSSEVYLGNGMSFSRDWYNRKRMGFYAAAQWRLSDQLEFFATAFRSRYTANKKQITMSFGSGGDAVTGAGSTNTFDADGNLTYTSGLSDWGQYGTGDGPVWNGDT